MPLKGKGLQQNEIFCYFINLENRFAKDQDASSRTDGLIAGEAKAVSSDCHLKKPVFSLQIYYYQVVRIFLHIKTAYLQTYNCTIFKIMDPED